MKMKEFFEELKYRIYNRGIRRLIPKYHNRTIFTKFFWRTWNDRRKRGFDETCTWGLYYDLAKLIAPRLKMFIGCASGFIPGFYITEVTNEMLAKGKKYDSVYHRFINKRDREYVNKEADKRWMRDLQFMYDAFNDIIQEEDDYDWWNKKKYEKMINKHNNAMYKLKTVEEQKAYWNSFGFTRLYHPRIEFMALDFSELTRKKGLELFAEHYQSLWW